MSILQKILDAGSDSLHAFGGKYVGGYYIQQNPIELSEAIDFLSQKSYFNYLEIGVAAAGTTRILHETLDIHGLTVLVDEGIHPSIRAREENLKHISHSFLIEADSHSLKAIGSLMEIGEQFDLIFIDGDHSYEGVVADTSIAMNFARPGAIFMYHDTFKVDGCIKLRKDLIDGILPKMSWITDFVDKSNPFGISIFQYD